MRFVFFFLQDVFGNVEGVIYFCIVQDVNFWFFFVFVSFVQCINFCFYKFFYYYWFKVGEVDEGGLVFVGSCKGIVNDVVY